MFRISRCRPTRGVARVAIPNPRHERFSSSPQGETVDLAYDLHKPEEAVNDERTKPILFLHGLFGSKKNNRTMSK
jgi:hypothetical protein